MSSDTPIVFDEAAVTEWVQACSAEAALRADGAPIEELASARTGVVAGLVSLIAQSVNPETTFALLALLLAEETPVSAAPGLDQEDPIPATAQDDNQSVAPDVESSSGDEN